MRILPTKNAPKMPLLPQGLQALLSPMRRLKTRRLVKSSDNEANLNKVHRDKPKLSKPKIRLVLVVTSGILIGLVVTMPTANANVFDSLLKILLPSYSEDDSSSSQDEEVIDEEDNQTSTDATNNDANNDEVANGEQIPLNEVEANSTITSTTVPSDADESTAVQDPLRTNQANLTIDSSTQFSIATLPTVAQSQRTSAQANHSQPSLYKLLEAEFAIDRGDVNRGLSIYKQESFNQNATPVFERALALSLSYDPVEESLTFSRLWQQQNPEHLPAQFYVAHLALKAHDYTLASDVLTRILNYDAQADLSEILIGIFPTTKADQQELLQTLQALPEHQNPSILTMQAGLLYQLEQYELALFNVSLALDAKPDNAPYIILKADILQQLKPPDDVIDFLSTQRQRLADDPNAKSIYLYEIRYRLKMAQSNEAWDLLIQTHNRFSSDPEITLLAALVSIDIEEYSTADKLLGSLATSPYYIDQAYYYLGISAERQHEYNRAERYLSKVMREDLVWEARKKVVAIQLLNANVNGALYTLQQLSAQFDMYAPDSTILQAEILRQQNKLAEAKSLLAAANERYPDDLDIMYARSQLLDNVLDFKLKHDLLERLMLLDPENTDYQINFAQLLYDTKTGIAQSLYIAQSIVDIPFNDIRFNSNNYIAALNLLASNALENQNYTAVITYLQDVYAVSPTLDSGILLLRAYQGLQDDSKVNELFDQLQRDYALGQNDINNRIQKY